MLEVLFAALFVAVLLGQNVILKWVANLPSIQSHFFFNILQHLTTAIATVLLVSFVLPSVYRLYRHFRESHERDTGKHASKRGG